jgi:uncharacterized membrane protein SpoIIM required for sporulation
MIKHTYPVMFFMFLTLLLPHGAFETAAVIGAVVTGIWGLRSLAK